MLRSVIPGHNNKRHLSYEEVENNVGGLPVTDNRLQELFNSLDTEHTGAVSLDVVKGFFNNLEHFGVPFSDKEVDEMVRKHSATKDDSLLYDEFACFMLRITQW